MYTWLCSHPMVATLRQTEIHYFDHQYSRGERWYRAQFPIRRTGRISLDSTPYMLFHPLAPGRAAQDLPVSTRFLALLRDPVQRAISHYWRPRQRHVENESLEVALALEEERLAGQTEIVLRGERSLRHQHYSYRARGHYAEQLCRWFDAVGRERILVVESEALFSTPEVSLGVLDWLGLPRTEEPFPVVNRATRDLSTDEATVEELECHFAPYNEDLFELLGRRMWGR